ncbi:MAG: hypothetical protein ABJG56_01240 [Lentilitoribacter sp.]
MMSFSQKYEEFEDPDSFSKIASNREARDFDNEKLLAFDAGYQAGWDDATAARQVSDTNLCDALVENLQEISFSFHEAKSGLINEVRPLFDEVLDTLLPEVIRMSIGPHIMEQISSLAREASDQLILVEVSSDDFSSLRAFFEAQNLSSFELKEQVEFTAGQVLLRIGGKEIEIDFEQTLREIKASINNLFDEE